MSMHLQTKIKISAIGAFAVFACVFFAVRGNTQTKVETAGERFKNIKVLNDMPADQLGKVMNIFAASLGVDCNFCHVTSDFSKDDKPEKQTARKMIGMVFAINKDNFNGRTEVSCNTCHNGREHPQSAPNLAPAAEEARPKQPDVKPAAQEIVAKYVQAVGGADKLAKIRSSVIKAVRVEADGKTTEPETLAFSGGKYSLKTTYGDRPVVEVYDGAAARKFGKQEIDLKPDEAEQIKREAELFSPANLTNVYPKLEYRAVSKIDGRDVYVLNGTTASGVRERLYFDTATGLLVRRSTSTPTILGNFVYQVDYSDYRTMGGIKLPATIEYSMPNMRWTRKVISVKNNVPVDASIFAAPKGA